MSFRTITPGTLPGPEWHQFLLSAVAPRPVAFVSTISAAGEVNLSPYSFFNVFSSNPATLIFSPANRVRDNTQKHTLFNVREVPECVVNICDYAVVEQMSLASTEYARGVNEFVKAGLTELPSDKVRPPRVAECPVSLECVVEQIIAIGDSNGGGNLVICRVVQAHFRESILLDSGPGIDPHKFDAVARLAGDWYSRVTPESLFTVPKPNRNLGIGIDQLPEHIRTSNTLTGNNLGRLANIEQQAIPTPEQVQAFKHDPLVSTLLQQHFGNLTEQRRQLTLLGKQLLEEGKLLEAWKVLLLAAG
ncbi:flavin reductase family protein [Hymenobacter sp. BT186]|uniref:Flavin reductase family protein n=1 Tax=Hymenobacter telluris TaxID=2816474 RepID=A0A939EXI2_9BACT|nr:flavin reductase family protein [Hymenobacter telluris]MBO0358966.1 flavin reductase family protein [Hymenobacter telluris]MBW3374992.1 flavin reductase family protein [Hymenobacter norwichensis]